MVSLKPIILQMKRCLSTWLLLQVACHVPWSPSRKVHCPRPGVRKPWSAGACAAAWALRATLPIPGLARRGLLREELWEKLKQLQFFTDWRDKVLAGAAHVSPPPREMPLPGGFPRWGASEESISGSTQASASRGHPAGQGRVPWECVSPRWAWVCKPWTPDSCPKEWHPETMTPRCSAAETAAGRAGLHCQSSWLWAEKKWEQK